MGIHVRPHATADDMYQTAKYEILAFFIRPRTGFPGLGIVSVIVWLSVSELSPVYSLSAD